MMNPVTSGDAVANLEARINQIHQGLLMVWRQVLRVRRTAYALDAMQRLSAAGRVAQLPLEFRSQFGEDLSAWDLLGRPLTGFYVEVGAFDGVMYSTTYALEAMGWTGLLIEPIPERAEACRRNRPHSRVVHAALGAPGGPGKATFHVLRDEYGGMLSYAEGLSNRHHLEQVAAGQVPQTSVEVPLTTMDALLEGHTGTIDFATIDVEGAETALLAGFDLARWRPRVLMIEDSTFGHNAELDRQLSRGPYVVVGWVESSRVCVRADERALIERAREVF
jgi:FkbM family methyltransferase